MFSNDAERAIYNYNYEAAVRNEASKRPLTEEALVWAHLVAHTIVVGTKPRSPFETSLPRISASGKTICNRCNGTGVTVFTWRERGVCFKCEGSGDSAHPYARTLKSEAQRTDSRGVLDPVCPGSGKEFYPDENQWMPCDVCGGDCQ